MKCALVMLFTLGIFLTGIDSTFAETSNNGLNSLEPIMVIETTTSGGEGSFVYVALTSNSNNLIYSEYVSTENGFASTQGFSLTSGVEHEVYPFIFSDNIIIESVECVNNGDPFVVSGDIVDVIKFTPQNGDNLVCTFAYVSDGNPTLVIETTMIDSDRSFVYSTGMIHSAIPPISTIVNTENGSGFTPTIELTSGMEYVVLQLPSDNAFVSVDCLNNGISFDLPFVEGNLFDFLPPVVGIKFTPQNGDNIVCKFVNAEHNNQAPIAVGTSPTAIALNELTNTIYVANNGADSVSVIKGDFNFVRDTITVGNGPAGIAVNESTGIIYVTSGKSDGKISVINGTDNTVTTTIPSGWTPYGIAVNESTNIIYVANYIPSHVQVINGDTNTEITTIPTGTWTADVAVNELTNTIYAANFRTGTVSVINGTSNTVTDTITVASGIVSIEVYESDNTIYVSDGTTVYVIDGNNNTVTDTIAVGTASSISLNESTNTLYVTSPVFNSVRVIDGATKMVIHIIDVGDMPAGIAVNKVTNNIYVANQMDNTVTVLTTTQ